MENANDSMTANGNVSAQKSSTKNESPNHLQRKEVPSLLVEATPIANGLFNWILASPMILFVGWLWVDLFAYFDPIPWYWLDALLGALIYLFLIVLPFGYLAHRLVTSFPALFQNAGWDVQPLEEVRPEEQYTVKYVCVQKERADTNKARIWMRAAQGWVYIEIATILIGAIVMIPLFFSAMDFGFGR